MKNYRAITENYRAINGKHVGSRNRLSRTLFPWTTMAATIEEVCFEVNRNKMATAKRKKLFKWLNIRRDIPYQSAPKYYSLFIDWRQNSRVCHKTSIQNPLKVTIFKEFQCVTVARSLSDRFSYSPAIIDCWPQKRLLMNVKPSKLLISAPAKISQG